jgi:hypothetical protein
MVSLAVEYCPIKSSRNKNDPHTELALKLQDVSDSDITCSSVSTKSSSERPLGNIQKVWQ